MTLWKKATSTLLLLSFYVSNAPAQRVVRVTDPDALHPAEVSVAINPKDPDNIIGASLQYGNAPKPPIVGYLYVSKDGGKTWKSVPNQSVENLWQGDDALAIGRDGSAYHAYLSFNGLYTSSPTHAASGIFVSASPDGGLTWGEPVPVINHINTVMPFEDKPAITADGVEGSRYKGNVYLSWTRFDVYKGTDPECRSHIYFSRSDDGGKTFSMPMRITDAGGDCRDDDGTVSGAVPAVGPRGEVYVVWAGPRGLIFDKSVDGGRTFGKDHIIGPVPGGWNFTVAGLERANGLPVIGIDVSTGPNNGTIYVNWIDDRNGDPDIFVASSRDGGESWSTPLRVNDDPVKNGKAQFLTWMAVDPSDGSVNIAFYDRRDTTATFTGLTLARSTDGGHMFVNYKIDQTPFACDETRFFGDYLGVAAQSGRVVLMYMHFSDGQKLAISSALFRFKPGTQQRAE